MGVGVSLILVAAGAILTWAVDATVSGSEHPHGRRHSDGCRGDRTRSLAHLLVELGPLRQPQRGRDPQTTNVIDDGPAV